jgi:hypothetical protein
MVRDEAVITNTSAKFGEMSARKLRVVSADAFHRKPSVATSFVDLHPLGAVGHKVRLDSH